MILASNALLACLTTVKKGGSERSKLFECSQQCDIQ